MKALVKYEMADGCVEVRTVADAVPLLGRVLVEVQAVGVCGSDIHMWRNSQSWPVKLPLILGHEMAGVVVDDGNLPGMEVGQRVVCETAESVCGRCSFCRSGAYNLCPHRRGYGAMADGSFARYLSVRPEIVHHVPDNVAAEHAAMTEPLCVAYNALIERVRIVPGDTVVIQGAGAIGIMATQVARLAGAGHVIVLGTGVDEHRLKIAALVGATATLDVEQDDPSDLLACVGDGFGAELVVDCTGSSAALSQSMQLVRPLGTIAKIGWGPAPYGRSLDPLVAKAATLAGAFSHTHKTWERALTLMSTGGVDLAPVLGGTYDLQDWERAFGLMEDGRNVKSVVTGFQ
jgi:alcohol dehydrogenase/L-iditol 2-dehydrogenase